MNSRSEYSPKVCLSILNQKKKKNPKPKKPVAEVLFSSNTASKMYW